MRPYNVGSERAISIADLARLVARVAAGGANVRIAGTPQPGATASRYVPSTARARGELGVTMNVELADAITRTADWYRHCAALNVQH